MTDPRTDAVVERALAPLRAGLEADGATLAIDGIAADGSTLLLRVEVGQDAACEDCFVGPDVMEQMVLDTLQEEGSSYTAVSVRTPT